MHRALASLAFVATSSFTLAAGAFCRTTTVSVPPGYDATVSGCETQGTPVAWPSMPVTYELHQTASTQISLDQATAIFDAAFAAWGAVSCPGAGAPAHPSLSFERLASTDAAFVPCDAEACDQAEGAGPHQIIFRDDAWPYHDSANAIALTTLTFGLETGHIHSANIEINSHDFALSAVDPPPSGEISLAAIARHEAGHFIGLAHADTKDAMMYAFYEPGATTLTADDIAGACTVYPPSSGCGCSTGGRASDATALGVMGLVLAAAWRRRRRPRRLAA